MGAEVDFNCLQFEKKLTTLKDSQDSINACCVWCLENRDHHKKIVSTWLNVLKRVRVEQRLTLFYLANDVIQYSKRKSFDFVESWGTALQKATTMVRDEKVKHKILRIFKIWEHRGVYGEEFITDLCGLISVSPSAKKTDESHEFQSNVLINKIRNCAKLESDTDQRLRLFKQHSQKMMDLEALLSSLKDRAHVDDVEKEMEEYVSHMEEYVNALKLEIKARNQLIALLLNAETQLERDRKDVKVVAVAYKSFATRVKNLKKKLDEKRATLQSPIPSPDINAPSPSPDSDIELPDDTKSNNSMDIFSYTNAGFYNPVTSTVTDTNNSFVNNGFSSFMGSNAPFNMQNLNTSAIFGNSSSQHAASISQTHTTDSSYSNSNIASLFPSIIQPPPPPAPVPPVTTTTSYQYNLQMPLAPPPLPPFTKTDNTIYGADSIYTEYTPTPSTAAYGNNSYNSQQTSGDLYQPSNPTYTPSLQNYNNPNPPTFEPSATLVQNDQSYPYDPYNLDEYNPEEELETWDNDEQWDQPPQPMDTPASPPPLEKEAFMNPIEYHDAQDMVGGLDVDHRVLSVIPTEDSVADKKKDVHHRNLISLTGSPREANDTKSSSSWKTQNKDQDYRIKVSDRKRKDSDSKKDKNYALAAVSAQQKKHDLQSPRKTQDNTESIDMELSDDDIEEIGDDSNQSNGVLPPPPFPDDADANNFLDSLNDELSYDESYGNFDNAEAPKDDASNSWNESTSAEQWNESSTAEQWDESSAGLLGDCPDNWTEQGNRGFRGRIRGNRGHFGGNRGEFNNGGNRNHFNNSNRGGDFNNARGNFNNSNRGEFKNGSTRGEFNNRGNFHNSRGEFNNSNRGDFHSTNRGNFNNVGGFQNFPNQPDFNASGDDSNPSNFNNWGSDFRGRGRVFRGGVNKFRGGWNNDQRNQRMRNRGGRARGFNNQRGNFRGGFGNNFQ